MATAHLIHGYLGVGKTTFARRIERERGAVRFTHDEWMSTLYGPDPPAEQFGDCAERVCDAVRATVRALGCDSTLYSLHCPETVARARCRARNADLHGSLYISDATFDALQSRFEPLDDDEARTLVDTDDHA